MTTFTRSETPFGPLLLVAEGGALTGLYFAGGRHAPQPGPDWQRDPGSPIFAAVELQLREFAAGGRSRFEIPLRLDGTEFQRAVWERIRAIPYGETLSYRELAQGVNAPRAIRAAAAATGRNPLSLIVPCHRVIGSDGSLTGYAGGLERKRALLQHEAAVARRQRDEAARVPLALGPGGSAEAGPST